MNTKQERIAEAREHYEHRKDDRPKQTWDSVKREWVKS